MATPSVYGQTIESDPLSVGFSSVPFHRGAVTSEPTEQKPESKLWHHDGHWWGVMWNNDDRAFRIYRLDTETQDWTIAGPELDTRPRTSADALSDGGQVYIISRAKLNHKDEHGSPAARLLRLSYDWSAKRYNMSPGFPVELPGIDRTRVLTLAQDSSGQLWIAWIAGKKVMINRSLSADTTWGAPFELPSQEKNLPSEELAAITAFAGDKIGVAWSNQDTKKLYFAVHNDADDDSTWSDEEVALGGGGRLADDHINISVTSGGVVCLVSKTSLSDPGDPLVYMSKRSTTGNWSNHVVWRNQDGVTRPIGVISADENKIYVFARTTASSPSAIYMKSASIANPNFPNGLGTPFIQDGEFSSANNPSTTKQTVNASTGLVVLASDKPEKVYLHNYLSVNNNIAPLAVNDSARTNENEAVNVDVVANDTDGDGTIDASSVALVSAPRNGVGTVDSGTGVVTYAPDPGFSGPDTLTYTVRDDDGDYAIAAAVFISVNAAPIAYPDSADTPEDGAISIDVAANDQDTDGTINLTSLILDQAPSRGTAQLTSPGHIDYTPEADFHGADSLSYTIRDNEDAQSQPAWVLLSVTDVNDPPIAENDQFSINENQPVQLDVVANDADIDGSIVAASILITAGPASGSASVLADSGAILYESVSGFSHKDTLFYVVMDDDGAVSNSAQVVIDVNGRPVAQSDSAHTNQGDAVTIDVLQNDADPDGNLQRASLALVSTAIGSAVADTAAGNIIYTPDPEFYGSDTLVYEISDEQGLVDSASVSIAVNGRPTAGADSAHVTQGVAIAIPVLQNDHDPDGHLDSSSVTIGPGPDAGGTVSVDTTSGEITYTSLGSYFGPERFGYLIEDNLGLKSDTAFVTLFVNSPPIAMDDSATTDQDVSLQIGILANDQDPDANGGLVVASVSLTASPEHGVATMDTTIGEMIYAPDNGFWGADSFSYVVADSFGVFSNPAQVRIQVNDVNYLPTALNDTTTTNEDSSVVVAILANDSDSDGLLDPSSIAIVTPPAFGVAVVDPDSGTVLYTPNLNFAGRDSFGYRVADHQGGVSNDAVGVIQVHPVNDLPVAVRDSVTTEEDQPATVAVLANDVDVEGALDAGSVTLLTLPRFGAATVDTATGTVTYVPGQDYVGTDTLSYRVSDQEGAVSNSALVAFLVQPVNDLPVALNDTTTTNEDSSVVVAILANDSDLDGLLDSSTIAIVTPPAFGAAVVNPDSGTVLYAPNLNFAGTDSFVYRVSDDLGGVSNDAVGVIQVHPVNDLPVAVRDSVTTEEDQPVTAAVLANDVDVEGALDAGSVTLLTLPRFGTATVDTATGTVTYVPGPDYVGTDTLSYRVSDQEGAASNSALVAFLVQPVNDLPVALNDTTTTNEDSSVVVAILANDSDSDGHLDSSTIAIVTPPAFGAAVVDPGSGTVLYAPNLNFAGTDSFVYRVSDDLGGSSNPARAHLHVSPVNDLPVANDDSTGTRADIPVSIPVLANDADIEGALDSAGLIITKAPSAGTAVVDTLSGAVLYTPNFEFIGVDSLGYRVADQAGGLSNEARLLVTVLPGNQPPIAANDTASTVTADSVDIAVSENDSDPDGQLDSGSVAIVSPALNGQTSVPAPGVVRYVPGPGFAGSDSLTYTILDDQGEVSNIARVIITVHAPSFYRIAPIADGQVKISRPTRNYGDKLSAKVEVATYRTYFKFAVTGVIGDVRQALLKLFVVNGSDSGGSIYLVSNKYADGSADWAEDGLIWNNAPIISGQALETNGPVTAGEWISLDLSEAITGNGVYSFALMTSSENRAEYATKESLNPPELIVETGAAGDPTDPPPDPSPEQHTLTVTTLGSGEVALDPPGGVYDAGTAVSLTATAASGWVFSGWSDDLNGSDNPAGLTMDTGKQVTATFTEVIVPTGSTLSLSPIADGQVKFSRPTNNYGTKGTAKAELDSYHSFFKFNVSGITSAVTRAVLRLTVTNGSVSGGSIYQVSNNYSASSTPWAEGGLVWNNAPEISGSALSTLGRVSVETTVEFDVTAAISGNGVVSFGVRSDSDDRVEYQTKEGTYPPELIIELGDDSGPVLPRYAVNISTDGSGAVTLNPPGGEYDSSTVVSLTASAQPGWVFSGWSGDLSGSANLTDLTMDAGKQVTATFTQLPPEQHTLTVTATGSGTVSQDPLGQTHLAGTVVRLTALPDSGWVFSGWSGDWVSSAREDSLIIDGNKQIHATFTQPHLGDMVITINADDEYELWVNGALIGSNTQWDVAKIYTVPLVAGENLLAVHGTNTGFPGALIAEVRVNGQLVLKSDASWRRFGHEESGWNQPGFDDGAWLQAVDHGQYGVAPWNQSIIDFPDNSPASWIWGEVLREDYREWYFRGTFNHVLAKAGTTSSPEPLIPGNQVGLPETFELSQNYPNPFNPSTNLVFQLPEAVPVKLQVFDLQGRLIAILADEIRNAGSHRLIWHAVDASGDPLPSGVYFCRLEAGAYVRMLKMMLIR